MKKIREYEQKNKIGNFKTTFKIKLKIPADVKEIVLLIFEGVLIQTNAPSNLENAASLTSAGILSTEFVKG